MDIIMKDVFISHASEDKDAIARPLADELLSRGYTVWFDDFELRLGDSLSKSIDRGLADSRFGVVILSKSFFAKRWPERELAGLVSRETASGQKVILPVWHGVSHDDVLRFSPTLADRLAVETAIGVRAVADEVVSAIGALMRGGGGPAVTSWTRASFSFAPEQISELHRKSSIKLSDVQPAPPGLAVVPEQSIALSAVVAYEVPGGPDDVILTLEVNREPADGHFWHNVREKRVKAPAGRTQMTGLVPAAVIAAVGGRRLRLRACLVLFDNESGTRHSILSSEPVDFRVVR